MVKVAYRGYSDDGATFIDQTRQPIEFPLRRRMDAARVRRRGARHGRGRNETRPRWSRRGVREAHRKSASSKWSARRSRPISSSPWAT